MPKFVNGNGNVEKTKDQLKDKIYSHMILILLRHCENFEKKANLNLVIMS
jgi:hypothetical protein